MMYIQTEIRSQIIQLDFTNTLTEDDLHVKVCKVSLKCYLKYFVRHTLEYIVKNWNNELLI